MENQKEKKELITYEKTETANVRHPCLTNNLQLLDNKLLKASVMVSVCPTNQVFSYLGIRGRRRNESQSERNSFFSNLYQMIF